MRMKHSRIFQAALKNIKIADIAQHRWRAFGKTEPPDGSVRTNHASIDARDIGRSSHKAPSAGSQANRAERPVWHLFVCTVSHTRPKRLKIGCVLIFSEQRI
jgi:hypothetical protein